MFNAAWPNNEFYGSTLPQPKEWGTLITVEHSHEICLEETIKIQGVPTHIIEEWVPTEKIFTLGYL